MRPSEFLGFRPETLKAGRAQMWCLRFIRHARDDAQPPALIEVPTSPRSQRQSLRRASPERNAEPRFERPQPLAHRRDRHPKERAAPLMLSN